MPKLFGRSTRSVKPGANTTEARQLDYKIFLTGNLGGYQGQLFNLLQTYVNERGDNTRIEGSNVVVTVSSDPVVRITFVTTSAPDLSRLNQIIASGSDMIMLAYKDYDEAVLAELYGQVRESLKEGHSVTLLGLHQSQDHKEADETDPINVKAKAFALNHHWGHQIVSINNPNSVLEALNHMIHSLTQVDPEVHVVRKTTV